MLQEIGTEAYGMCPMAGFRTFYPYEYVSGVARLNDSNWKVKVYLVNRGSAEAMGSTSIIEALGAGASGIFGNAERFNSGEQVVPPGQYAFMQFSANSASELGLYWCRIVTTSRDLAPSVSFFRPSDDPAGDVPDFSFAPGDFAVFSPSSVLEPLGPIITSSKAE